MNPEFDDNNLIFSLFSSLTIAAIIFLTGCTGKKKTAAMESDYEQPPPLQTPVLARSKTSSASKGGPGTAPIETRLPNIPEQPKEQQQVPPAKEESAPPPEEKKAEEVKNVEEQKVEEKKSDKKEENEKKSEIKKSEKNDEKSKASAKVDSKKSSKSKSKVASEKKNEDNYQPINFGPDDLPPAPK
uniref:Uncharacterized protein n=1 Tax=Panagrolaimus sp. PS1159 TaxID=55785 RepID=A0AC35G774_9BILA